MREERRHAAQRLDENTEHAFTILCFSRRLRKLVTSEPISPICSPDRSRSGACSDIRGTHSHCNMNILGRCQCGAPFLIDSQDNLQISSATVAQSDSIVLCNGMVSKASRHDVCSSMAKTRLRPSTASSDRRQSFALICCAHFDKRPHGFCSRSPYDPPYKEHSQEQNFTSISSHCTRPTILARSNCQTTGDDPCTQIQLQDRYDLRGPNGSRSSTQLRRRQPPNMERLRTLDFGDEESYFSTDSSENESDDEFIGETWDHWDDC